MQARIAGRGRRHYAAVFAVRILFTHAPDFGTLKSPLRGPLLAGGGGLLSHLDEFDILAQHGVDEGRKVDALGVGEPGEAALHFGVQIHGQVQGGAGLVELAARAAGEIDLGRQFVIGWGLCWAHTGTYGGSFSYC